MPNIQVSEAFAPFTVDGSASGFVTVADNSNFYIRAYAYLFSDSQPPQFVRIISKPDLQKIGVLFLTPPDFLARYNQQSDCSIYTVADHARIDMYQQVVDVPDGVLIISTGGGGGAPTGPAGGDLYNTYPNPNVGGFRGRPLNTAAPTIGDVYQWDGTNWTPTNPLYSSFLQDTGLTLWATPQLGQIGYISGDLTLDLAKADNILTSKAYGAYWAPNTINVGGVFPVLFEAGLTLTANDSIYLSPIVAGRVTNREPSSPGEVIVELGILRSSALYDALLGNALYILWNPKKPILIPAP